MSLVPPIPSRKRIPSLPPPRRVAYTGNGDKVLWRWLAGADRKLPIAPVASLTASEGTAMERWIWERDANGVHVRATRVLIALWRRAYDRSRAGYKDSPAVEAYSELAKAIILSGGY